MKELPLQVTMPSYMGDFPSEHFAFQTPAEGKINGSGGIRSEVGKETICTNWISRILPGEDSWKMEQREVTWRESEYPGAIYQSVLSPDGRRMALLNGFDLSDNTAILVGDREGKNNHIVYEHFPLREDWRADRATTPWHRLLAWTPNGDALVFWRGEEGRNGLCLLPVPTRSLL